MSTIKTGTTLTTAYQVEGDTTGALVIQTGASPTTAVTIGSDQSTTLAGTLNLASQNMTPYTGFKNRIINGAMMIDQRNAGASITVNGGTEQYSVDRFLGYDNSSAVFTLQQSSTAPSGFVNSLLATVTTASGTLTTTQRDVIIQKIEGSNVSDLAWGTASAATVTLSFRVRSSLTGSFGGSLMNSATDRSYPFQYTISSANTWEQKSITIAGDTTGTWLTTNGVGVQVCWSLGVGPSLTGTANTWAAAGYRNSTGSVNLVETNGATFYITGVQLEKGSTATSFDYRPYGTELALCQRYYEQSYAYGTASGAASAGGYAASPTASNTVAVGQAYSQICFNVAKRAAPTVTLYGYQGGSAKVSAWNSGADLSANSGIPYTTSTQGFNAYNGAGVTVTTTNFGVIYHWTASIEL